MGEERKADEASERVGGAPGERDAARIEEETRVERVVRAGYRSREAPEEPGVLEIVAGIAEQG
jgi:hypothetical protein